MWFWLALFFAVWNSIGVVIAKKILKSTDTLVYIAFSNLVFLPFLFASLYFLGFPKLDNIFWQNIAFAAFLGIFVQLSYAHAIKIAPISLVVPMAAVTPVIATISGLLVLGEQVVAVKFFGVLLIAIGAYTLNISDIKKGFWVPFKALLGNRGVQLSLIGNVLVGITPLFEKTAIFHTRPNQPLMAIFIEFSLMALFFFPLMLKKVKNPFAQFKNNFWLFLLPAPLGTLASWAAFKAYSLQNLGYVTAVFKFSIFFGIIWGALFFGEKRFKERLAGGIVMILGTILLVI